MAKFNTDPARVSNRKAAGIKAAATRQANPVTMERMRENGRRVGATNIKATRTPEARAKAAKALSETARRKREIRMAWCPPERLAEFYRIAGWFGIAEARRMIEADMTPFELQLAKVRCGSNLVEIKPRRSADYGYTLGGVTPEVL